MRMLNKVNLHHRHLGTDEKYTITGSATFELMNEGTSKEFAKLIDDDLEIILNFGEENGKLVSHGPIALGDLFPSIQLDIIEALRTQIADFNWYEEVL